MMMKKNDKKQKILRNEFKTVGKYGIPLVKRQSIDINKVEPWGYAKAKIDDEENKNKTIHFFTYDWLYESVYTKPEVAMEKLDKYYALLTPDFSCYFNMPIALQINSTFKNRWCGAFWQKQGMKVIPTIEWGDENSFDFCFDGVEQGSVVAVSTYSREEYENEFLLGYNEMLRRIKPSAIICYGDLFEERNEILRWKLVADLSKFGGKGFEIKEREIPLIFNPYEGIELTSTVTNDMFETTKINLNPNILEPKVRNIVVDNYEGSITVIADYANKIQWISGGKTIKTKYNVVGKFTTKFSVENLECRDLQFKLIGEGGETMSQSFGLTKAT